MTYLIVGASGFLGSYFIKELRAKNQQIIATCRNLNNVDNDEDVEWVECDITNLVHVENLALKMNEYENYNIIFLSACHHPDFVEKNPEISWETNIVALSVFLNRMKKVRCLFYPSTDTVYGEGNIDYKFKESDKTNPINIYGDHKVLAEKIVTTYGYNVVRFPFLIGPSLTKQKKHFYDLIIETIQNGAEFEMFADSYRSTISFKQAAQYVIRLIEIYTPRIPQIINVAADKGMSKYDVGVLIAQKCKVDSKLIVPISILSDVKIFDAPRACTALIDNSLLKKFLNIQQIELEI